MRKLAAYAASKAGLIQPRWLVTTTPRPLKLLKELLAREGSDVVVTRGSTFENAANLAPRFLAAIRARYEGTRLGRQEIYAELFEDTPGALWSRDMIEGRMKSANCRTSNELLSPLIHPAHAELQTAATASALSLPALERTGSVTFSQKEHVS
jgi:phage terminase large subunit-like protein